MESNPLQSALEKRLASHGPQSVINLVDSNFHGNGFIGDPEILAEGFGRYLARRHYQPDSRGELAARQAIADFYNQGGPVSRTFFGDYRANPEHILLTASSSESYNLLFQAFCEPGDNVLLPLPAYPLFEDLCRYNHLEARFYPLKEESGWQPDLDVLDSLCDQRTRFAVLISPNNPCGSVLTDRSLDGIMEICLERQVMVISDEVFSEFLYRSAELPRAMAWRSATQPVPVFTINGISKLFASPDLKLSWILATGPSAADSAFPGLADIYRELELRNDTFLNCGTFSQFILPDLFRKCPDFVRDMTARCRDNRTCLERLLLPALPVGTRLRLPDGGIHCVLSFSSYAGIDDETLALRLLTEHGLYLHPGYLYGMDEDPCLILSILKDPAAFTGAVARLAGALREFL